MNIIWNPGYAMTVEAARVTEHNYEPIDDPNTTNRNKLKSMVELAEMEFRNNPNASYVSDPVLPAAPTGLSLTGNVLSWNAVPGSNGYNVWASVTAQSGLDYAPLALFLSSPAAGYESDLNAEMIATTSYDLTAAIAAGFDVTYLAVTTVDEVTDGINTAIANSYYSAEIPEPATLLLLLVGGASLLRRKK